MEPDTREPGQTLCYGDFPELFWDAKADVAIDVRNPVTLTRLLTRGHAEVIGRLVPLELLRERLDTLTLPDHVRIFWRAVLQSDSGVDLGATLSPEGS